MRDRLRVGIFELPADCLMFFSMSSNERAAQDSATVLALDFGEKRITPQSATARWVYRIRLKPLLLMTISGALPQLQR